MKKRNKNTKCYYCGKEIKENNKDHVPPKMLFPKEQGFRKALISVSTCKEHNQGFSNDDLYFCYIISLSNDCNSIPHKYIIPRLIRAFNKDKKLVNRLFKKSRKILFKNPVLYEESLAITVDLDIFNLIVIKIAKGLYFYKTNEVWKKELEIYSSSLKYEKLSFLLNPPLHNSLKELMISSQGEIEGENPEVFKFKFIESKGRILIAMQFYEGPVICVYEK